MKKNKEDIEENGSVVGGIKGFQAPLAQSDPGKNTKGKKGKSVYSESEKFTNMVAKKELLETIRKQGSRWVIIDPKTGAEVATATSRDHAREVQRQLGIGTQRKEKQKSPEEPESVRQKRGLTPQLAHESLKTYMKKILEHSGMKLVPINESVFSYAFEHSPIDENEMVWENFLGKLSDETKWSDENLKTLVTKIKQVESRVLERAAHSVRGVLESTGQFKVAPGKTRKNSEGFLVKDFEVFMKENDSKLAFGLKLDNKRPLLIFPESSRHAINNMANDESKLLRAELMHIQETVLDLMDDVLRVGKKRDTYLESVQKKLMKVVDSCSLLELALLKNLMRRKS